MLGQCWNSITGTSLRSVRPPLLKNWCIKKKTRRYGGTPTIKCRLHFSWWTSAARPRSSFAPRSWYRAVELNPMALDDSLEVPTFFGFCQNHWQIYVSVKSVLFFVDFFQSGFACEFCYSWFIRLIVGLFYKPVWYLEHMGANGISFHNPINQLTRSVWFFCCWLSPIGLRLIVFLQSVYRTNIGFFVWNSLVSGTCAQWNTTETHFSLMFLLLMPQSLAKPA